MGPSTLVLEYESRSARWKVGTLTYTTGGLLALFFWFLGGDFFWQLRDRALAPAMPLLIRQFGGSDFIAGLLIGTIPPALAILFSPIISYRSDRHRGRWGRRIPFLLVAAPPAFLAMVGLALSPLIGRWINHWLGPSSPGLTTCVIGTFAIFWVIFDLAVVVTNSVHTALIADVVPHEVLGRFFGCFRVLSLGAGMLFNYFLLGQLQRHYVVIFITIGVFYLICFVVMCLMVKEGKYPPPPAPIPGGPVRRTLGAVEQYASDCFTHPYYLWIFLSFTLAYMSFTPVNLFSLYFAQSVGMSMSTYGKFGALQLLCSLIQAPILGWLADKIHPLRLTIISLLLYGLTTMLAFFFVHDQRTFAIAYVATGTCAGFWLTASAPLAPVLLPKLKFATFASALAICTSLGSMLTAPVIGWLLDLINKGRSAGARNYHSIYLWASLFIVLSLLATIVVYRKFIGFGGTRAYTAPE
jgi:MFS family permease